MTVTDRMILALAMGAAGAMLLAALGFQYLGGLPPCTLCHYQRLPYAAAILIALIGLLSMPVRRGAVWLMLPVGLASVGLGLFHWGVEQGWWQWQSACTQSGGDAGMSIDDLRAQIMAAPVVRCDEPLWSLFGLSMAGWNMLLSLAATAGLAVILIWRRR